MTAPRRVAHDAASAKDRCDELCNATVAAVGEHTPMPLTEHLDLRTTVVDWIVTIARTARGSRDDLEVTTTHQHLCIAGVTVVLRLCRMRVVPRSPRTTPVTVSNIVEESASLGVIVATIRCAADFEIWNTAASSRVVRFVRNAAQAISTR
jgi:hypothetical protein